MVSLSTGIEEFPNDNLIVIVSKLFCNALRENVSLKKSVLTQHIKSAKHATEKKRLASKELRERNI